MLEEVVLEVDMENVVQVVKDNVIVYVMVRRLINTVLEPLCFPL
jgi:hypothetical protein